MMNFSQYGTLILTRNGVTVILLEKVPNYLSAEPHYRFSEAFLNEVILFYTGFLVKIIVFLYI